LSIQCANAPDIITYRSYEQSKNPALKSPGSPGYDYFADPNQPLGWKNSPEKQGYLVGLIWEYQNLRTGKTIGQQTSRRAIGAAIGRLKDKGVVKIFHNCHKTCIRWQGLRSNPYTPESRNSRRANSTCIVHEETNQ
jgi:hypothetical protein